MRVALRVAAEQQGGQGGRVHDALQLVDDRQLQPGVGAGAAQRRTRPRSDLIVDSGSRRLTTRPSRRDREERLDHRHQPEAGELGDRVGAWPAACDGAGVVEADPGEHLAAVEAVRGDVDGAVGGEAVVQLERRAL